MRETLRKGALALLLALAALGAASCDRTNDEGNPLAPEAATGALDNRGDRSGSHGLSHN